MGKQKTENRKLGLFQASVLNMIDMVGIGPFIVLSLVIGKMNGPYFLYAWIAGALLAVFDAMIWSELGATYPKAGGSYNFLRETFGKHSLGSLISFLFIWQTLFQAPMVMASGSLGFAKYFDHLIPLNAWQTKLVAAGIIVVVTLLVYRKIETIGKIGTFLWIAVVITLGLIIFGGIWKGDFLAPLREMNHGLKINALFFVVLGSATIKTMYSFGGYYNVCYLGGDVKNPEKNIPRSMFIAIGVIALLYLLMNISVTSVIPWQVARGSDSVVSLFAEKVYGKTGGTLITVLILGVAMASLFAVLLGYSRIPYAAAKEGQFIRIFGKEHPRKKFPYISVLFIAGFGLLFSLFFNLSQVITGIFAMRIIIQFIGQGVGVVLLSIRKGRKNRPYKMPLYPLPVIIAVAMWLAIFIATGASFMIAGGVVILAGTAVYFIQAYYTKKWPFGKDKRSPHWQSEENIP